MSKKRARRAGGMFDRPGLLLIGAAVIVILLWAGFTAGFKVHEMLVGVVSTALTIAFFAQVLRSESMSVTFRWRDLLAMSGIPASIAKDSVIVLRLLFRDLLGKGRVESFYVACGFKTSRRDPLLVGRSALAVAYSTMSPNMIVIGVDPEQSLMLYHQLERDRVPAFTRELGAADGTPSINVWGNKQ